MLNIYTEGELERDSTIRDFRIVRQEGARKVTRSIEHYNLDVIIKTQEWVLGLLYGELTQSFYTNEIVRRAAMGPPF